jgi:hypothetical protein
VRYLYNCEDLPVSNAALLQRFVDIAVHEVGLKELPGHANTGPEVEKYQKATWLSPGPWPWCAAFVAWCMREWLKAGDVRAAYNLPNDAAVASWRFRSAKAFDFETWGTKRGMLVLPETELARMGDVITFDFSHIGIVRRDEVRGHPLQTVEGNTNGAGSREGDGVYLKTRPDGLTRRYIRLLP